MSMLLNPKRALRDIDVHGLQHPKIDTMRDYLSTHGLKFNESQRNALTMISEMPKGQMQLIQGPPGTGKTQTILGLLSMLVFSGVKKILLCTPSNAALDEIVSRVTQRGLLGCSEEKAFKVTDLVRVGAIEYEPLPCVRKHTLDEQVEKLLLGEEGPRSTKLNEMRDQLALVGKI
jgi:senataxin